MTISELETIAFAIIKKSLTNCLKHINISRDVLLYLKKAEYFVCINYCKNDSIFELYL